MTNDEAKTVFLNRGYVEVDGGTIYDPYKWRESCRVISEWLEQEPSEDRYIKVPKKALKYRTAGMVAYNAEWLKNHFDMERAVICGEQQPCEDCISRKRVVEWLENATDDSIEHAIDSNLEFIPPVIPQPKIGHWIERRNRATGHIESVCSECGAEEGYPYNDYCGNCGAKMFEPQESEVEKNEET